jgi:hypothetical protein
MIHHRIIHKDTISEEEHCSLVELCADFRNHENYSDENWQSNPKSLLYKLYFTDSLHSKNGGLVLVYDDLRLVHIAGFTRSEFHGDIFLGGVRTLTVPKYRHRLLMSSYSVPMLTAAVIEMGGKMIMYTFDKDKSLYKIFVNKKFNLFLRNRQTEFDVDTVYGGMQPYEHAVYINYTVQHVLYKYVDTNFNFDWQLIRVQNDIQNRQ